MTTVQILATNGTVAHRGPSQGEQHATPDPEMLILECFRLNAEMSRLHQEYVTAVGELLVRQQQTMNLLLDVTRKIQ